MEKSVPQLLISSSTTVTPIPLPAWLNISYIIIVDPSVNDSLGSSSRRFGVPLTWAPRLLEPRRRHRIKYERQRVAGPSERDGNRKSPS
ncbi:hypothetical protein IG631_05274 [Alternaria alternata]|nr:hypothetical protein IG631_05274 [Alternaria alternata]